MVDPKSAVYCSGRALLVQLLAASETLEILWQSKVQWEFQEPSMHVLYHKRQYFVGIFPYIYRAL